MRVAIAAIAREQLSAMLCSQIVSRISAAIQLRGEALCHNTSAFGMDLEAHLEFKQCPIFAAYSDRITDFLELFKKKPRRFIQTPSTKRWSLHKRFETSSIINQNFFISR
jgi:hypothetical protein